MSRSAAFLQNIGVKYRPVVADAKTKRFISILNFDLDSMSMRVVTSNTIDSPTFSQVQDLLYRVGPLILGSLLRPVSARINPE
jgi:hypothetical protein